MEFILAKKLDDLEINQLVELLTKLRMENHDAFEVLKEIIQDF